MKAFTLLLALLILPCVFLNGQNIRWAEVINNAFTDNIFDLQVDNDHNLVICGQFNGTVDFDPGPAVNAHTSAGGADIFLAKYDSLGNYLWAHHFGTGFLTDEGDRLAIDSAFKKHLRTLRRKNRARARHDRRQRTASGRVGNDANGRRLVSAFSGQRRVWTHRSSTADDLEKRFSGDWN
jgi:hypothetical protein